LYVSVLYSVSNSPIHTLIMMKQVVLLVAFFAVFSMVSAETTFMEAVAECHPECRWQCDDPVCPAVCHPVCERPKCQIQCEETECAKCTVHCDKPQCNVRCPKDLCEKKDCPKCETVCSPANCRTSCVAPDPVCTPMCEETKCDWKCKKPTTCPKPKCELQCDKPACEAKEPQPIIARPRSCCSCTQENTKVSMLEASNSAKNSPSFQPHLVPSFMEVMHSIKFHEAAGNAPCCACAAK